jgi:hypothetical protein
MDSPYANHVIRIVEPLHRRAVWILRLEPVLGWTRPIGMVTVLGDDALQAEPTGVAEYDRPVAG